MGRSEQLRRDVAQLELIAASRDDATGLGGIFQLPPVLDIGPVEDSALMFSDYHDPFTWAGFDGEGAWFDENCLEEAAVARR